MGRSVGAQSEREVERKKTHHAPQGLDPEMYSSLETSDLAYPMGTKMIPR